MAPLLAGVMGDATLINKQVFTDKENKMGYAHIRNLYRHKEILLFKQCYALEKVHGTSTHLVIADGAVSYFSGGVKRAYFISKFDESELLRLAATMHTPETRIEIYGEAYGGSVMKMKQVYGDEMRFVAFDVKIGGHWLSVPDAADVVVKLDLEFVPYSLIMATIEEIDRARERASAISSRRGMGLHEREGIVLRPPVEMTGNNGERICAKHKNEKYEERMNPPKVVDEARLAVLEGAKEIAQEWVTPMRLTHVMDKLGKPEGVEATGNVVKAMVADVEREAEGEIVISRESRTAIGRRAAELFRAHLEATLRGD